MDRQEPWVMARKMKSDLRDAAPLTRRLPLTASLPTLSSIDAVAVPRSHRNDCESQARPVSDFMMVPL